MKTLKTAEEWQSGELSAAMNDAQQIAVIKAIQLDVLKEAAKCSCYHCEQKIMSRAKTITDGGKA